MARHLSVRCDDELFAAVDAMARGRDVDRSEMVRRMLQAALTSRQRACSEMHHAQVRCHLCGVRPPKPGNPMEHV